MTNGPGLDGWLEKISAVHPASMVLTLDRVGEVHRRLGSVAPAPISIVVGGTNGKGSSVAMLSSILHRAGFAVGRSTSPHLFRFNERVQINNRPVSDSELIAAFEAIDEARGDILLTYFEYATLAALWHFARADVDVALLEVGLGGRLDAVNIIDAQAALITSISRDHTRWLGDSLGQIAREKAGVFKPGQIAVSATANAPAELAEVAAAVKANFFVAGRDYQVTRHPDHWNWCSADIELSNLPLPGLAGAHQVSNAAGCLMILHKLGLLEQVTNHVRPGLAHVRLPGRLWQVADSPQIILDVAHNEAGAQVLADWLAEAPCSGRTILVLGMLKDKEPAAFVQRLRPLIDQLLLGGLPLPRGLDAGALAASLAPGDAGARRFKTIGEALKHAVANGQPDDRILVTGSFVSVEQGADQLGLSDNPTGLARRGEFSERGPAG